METEPECTQCGRRYSTPEVYKQNWDLCETCRPMQLCTACNGKGMVFYEPKNSHGFGDCKTCERCKGTRHEQ